MTGPSEAEIDQYNDGYREAEIACRQDIASAIGLLGHGDAPEWLSLVQQVRGQFQRHGRRSRTIQEIITQLETIAERVQANAELAKEAQKAIRAVVRAGKKLSLREQVALTVMQGSVDSHGHPEDLAVRAFEIADAFIKEAKERREAHALVRDARAKQP